MKLIDLKYFVESAYELNMSKRSRARDYVYARKVFVKLAKDYGYEWVQMKRHIDATHDLCIYHYKTFDAIRPKDLRVYNGAIQYFQIGVDHIENIRELSPTIVRDNVNREINRLNARDFKYFNNNIFKPFLAKLELEKKFSEVGLELKEGTSKINTLQL